MQCSQHNFSFEVGCKWILFQFFWGVKLPWFSNISKIYRKQYISIIHFVFVFLQSVCRYNSLLKQLKEL